MATPRIIPYQELVAANVAVRKVLDNGAEAQLRAIPGVLHVSVGVKIQARSVTRVLAIRVVVREKRREGDVPLAERIPKFIDGIPTDVTTPSRPAVLAGKVVRGGTVITNRVVFENENHQNDWAMGTFGFTATRNGNGKAVIVSNHHVLIGHGARIGDWVYDSAQLNASELGAPRSWLPYQSDKSEDRIGTIVDARFDGTVDVAIAELAVSSCCRCCGLDFRDEIQGLSVSGAPPSNQILGRRPAMANSIVYKVGMASGRTVGTVIDDRSDHVGRLHSGPLTEEFPNQIQIANEDTSETFSAQGDSGAAIIDQDGYVIGLLFASAYNSEDDIEYTYANHIADVMDTMDITPNFKGGGTTSGVLARTRQATFPMELSPSGAELYAATRARVEADPAGHWLWQLAEEHREEIVTLVTTHRRVSVVWHRVGGPAVFAAALNTLRAGDGESLPAPPASTLEEAMARVGVALATHGSVELRAALVRHRGALLAAVRGSRTLTEFLDRLRPHVHDVRGGMPVDGAPA